jgi:uncharacterized protein DUF1707
MFFLLPDDDLRVSDADRDAAVDFLNRHYAAGRLTEREHSARTDAAYAARFDSQLEALTADLPPLPAAGLVRRESVARRVGPAVKLAAVAAAGIAALAVIPPDAWATLIALGLPLVVMLLFTVGPIAVPLLLFAWLARALSGGSGGTLPRRRWSSWELPDRSRRWS